MAPLSCKLCQCTDYFRSSHSWLLSEPGQKSIGKKNMPEHLITCKPSLQWVLRIFKKTPDLLCLSALAMCELCLIKTFSFLKIWLQFPNSLECKVLQCWQKDFTWKDDVFHPYNIEYKVNFNYKQSSSDPVSSHLHAFSHRHNEAYTFTYMSKLISCRCGRTWRTENEKG